MEVQSADIERAIVFLSQYRDWLKTQKYPPYEYRVDAIDDLIARLECWRNGGQK